MLRGSYGVSVTALKRRACEACLPPVPSLFIYKTPHLFSLLPDSKQASNMADTTTTPIDTNDANAGKRAELRLTMLKKLRPYPLRHEWVLWHEKYLSLPAPRAPLLTANK